MTEYFAAYSRNRGKWVICNEQANVVEVFESEEEARAKCAEILSTEYKNVKYRIEELDNKYRELFREHLKPINEEMRRLEELSKQVCDHEDIRQETQSYEEPGRVRYHEWQQWVCQVCGREISDRDYEEIQAVKRARVGDYMI